MEMCMEFGDLLDEFREIFENQRDKGTKFEDLILNYLKLEPLYASQIEDVWMWSDFPHRSNVGDTGIDLVARTYSDDYWAIQCKFYDSNYTIRKADVDTFLATSSKSFFVEGVKRSFTCRLLVSTTDKYSNNAEDVLHNQNPQVIRIGMNDLLESNIDWQMFSINKKLEIKEKYKEQQHQIDAVNDIKQGFAHNDRGQLIMACGTGKTFTSLRAVEEVLHGKGNILFMVPSIALINQTLTEWTSQCNYTYNAIVVCSDNKASKGENFIDLKIPSTTDIEKLYNWVEHVKIDDRDLNIVFSTYQSIDVVSRLQKKTGFYFDIAVCDEAHRTTGVTLSDEDESYFVKVHDNNFIKSKKRLYMTATPRIYNENTKNKAQENNAILCSMEDNQIYGPIFHNLTFSKAVNKELLTDYKVLVLAIDEEYVKRELQDLLVDGNHEIKLDDTVKIMGCWNGLSKKSINKEGSSFIDDPIHMKRAVAFCNRIKDSKSLVNLFNLIQEYINTKYGDEFRDLVNIEIEHVDGSYNTVQKNEKINWLKEKTENKTCRILTNARCLSEGIDVPALDAVIFLNPRNSVVDIIQSVGRVMRKSKDKKYGYIILPVGISINENPDYALENNKKYKIIWSVLQALRAHDDRFNNTINKIELNKKRPKQIDIIGIGKVKDEEKDNSNDNISDLNPEQLVFDLNILDNWKDSIYAKIVKNVGSRIYWESWAKDVANIAQRHVERINILLDKKNDKINKVFNDFVAGLRKNLNDSITRNDAIDMLAQHLITKPVFDALFEGYEFVKNNPVSQTMQEMMELIDSQALDEEKEKLAKFYESVKERANEIDNIEGKQKIIIELYDKFFKTALPKEVEKLGIVYTPTECVDFIIHSVEKLLNQEFGMSMSDKGVHIIDGFTGTGTFVVRLLQSGIIKMENLLYKYTNEIHANEIVLLAYYIAAINIEETFHYLTDSKEYTPFEGIVLTDTFQLYEGWKEDEFTKSINEKILPENSERAKRQRNLDITVCIGNPPYSKGQKNQNDNAENMSYKKLDESIELLYANETSATNKNRLYDSYIRAFRWATERIIDNGIIGFITNSGWINKNTFEGFRKSICKEFNKIYVLDLKGALYGKVGTDVKKEGQNIFNIKTGVAITFLVKNKFDKENSVYYASVSNYMQKKEKLDYLNTHSIEDIEWEKIIPNEKGEWIEKGNNQYNNFIPLFPKKKFDLNSRSVFTLNSMGVNTSRDSWVYSFSSEKLSKHMENHIKFYNSQIDACDKNIKNTKDKLSDYKNNDPTKISWSSSLISFLNRKKYFEYDNKYIVEAMYRPFQKQKLYYGPGMIHRKGQFEDIFIKDNNMIICVNGKGCRRKPSSFISRNMVDLNLLEAGAQCMPLYWYHTADETNLFADQPIRNDGISDYIQKKVENKYSCKIEKIEIFNYVYGILNSKDFLKTFEFNLKNEQPKIYLVDSKEQFQKISEVGKKLIDLHLNYEVVEPYKYCNVIEHDLLTKNVDNIYYLSKMKFSQKNKKDEIDFNEFITITNIPIKAYDFIINGKSAIEWIMERYSVSKDKKSGIVNDPNDWCEEVNNPKYILNLLLSIINVSIKTVELIKLLPKLDFD